MDMSQLKTQILTMLMMRSSNSPNPKGGLSDIWNILYSMMLMNLLEWVFKSLPAWQGLAIKWAEARLKKKQPEWLPLKDKGVEKAVIHSITMTRVFGGKMEKVDNVYVEKVDAVLEYICSLDSAQHIRIDTRSSVNNADEIILTPQLKARVKTTQNSGTEESSVTELVLFSTVLKVSEIRGWVDTLHAEYVAEKNNKLGNKMYYFNEVATEPAVQATLMPDGSTQKTYRWENMPKLLTFNMNEFCTSKSFNNVYGDHVSELKERLDLFVNHPEWYKERGIPYSLGILLHGIPGAGKTSTIKAIAHDTHRHIFNLSLRPHTTQKQLTNLFFNETVVIQNYDGGKSTLKIPLNKRVYVIEDIDCLTDVVTDRRLKEEKETQGDAVTLSYLLNLLDGVLETPGRILIVTSNYPEKLDQAFVRPGRIDVKIEFKRADRAFILDMINKFYKQKFVLAEIPVELDHVFTPAEVMESMCMNFKDPFGALKHLVAKCSVVENDYIGTKLVELGAIEEKVEAKSIPTNTIISTGCITIEDRPCACDYEKKYVCAKHDTSLLKGIERMDESEHLLFPQGTLVITEVSDVDKIMEKRAGAVTEPELKKGGRKSGFFSALWGTPEFTDAVIPEGAGGDMPGSKGIRSDVNLNELH